jgi:molybdenum cofactor synthesis domain-containing protein
VSRAPTAACAVIGDEILTGKVHDKNSHTLAQIMFERGVRFERVVTIPDGVDLIADTVRELSARHDHVFTSGGIGPTHDDMTYAGVAKAFGRGLTVHEETLRKMEEWFEKHPERGQMNDARRRMALLPEGCDVWNAEETLWVPLVVVENVHVLPGVPWLFERLIRAIAPRFTGTPLTRRTMTTQMPEADIAAALDEAQRLNPDVAIGSYPQAPDAAFKVRVTFEGEVEARVQKVADAILDAIEGTWEPAPGDM